MNNLITKALATRCINLAIDKEINGLLKDYRKMEEILQPLRGVKTV